MSNPYWRIWVCLVIVAMVTDWTMLLRRLSGRLGEQSRAEVRASIAKFGGIWLYAAMSLCADVLLPPLVLIGCMFGYLKDQKRKAAQ